MSSINRIRRLPGRSCVALAVLAAILSIQGCENPTEDRRITLCKDIAVVELGLSGPVDWQEVKTSTNGPRGALIGIRFRPPFTTDSDEPSGISCFYHYNAVDDTALGLADPLSNYSTSPTHVEIDGRPLTRSQLAEAIKQAMRKQARGLLDGG